MKDRGVGFGISTTVAFAGYVSVTMKSLPRPYHDKFSQPHHIFPVDERIAAIRDF